MQVSKVLLLLLSSCKYVVQDVYRWISSRLLVVKCSIYSFRKGVKTQMSRQISYLSLKYKYISALVNFLGRIAVLRK